MPVQKIHCGNHTVYWLPDTPLPPSLSAQLHPDELQRAQQIKHHKHRTEFIKSRWLYHHISGNATPLLNRSEGDCIWPTGYTGSLSHKEGRVALIYTQHQYRVGVDLELVKPCSADLANAVLTPAERPLLAKHSHNAATHDFLLLTIFSAKEALFKCLFPLKRKRFYLHDATAQTIDLQQRTILFHCQQQHLTCHWHTLDDAGQKLIVTTTSISP